jgi:beta-N-acetylhexosaminidase
MTRSATGSAADRALASGCLMGSFVGTVAPEWLLASIREGLGGVLLFAQNVVDDDQVAALCARLRLARSGVVIAIDEEGGDVTRLDALTGSATPCPAAFGHVDDTDATREAYAALGRRVGGLDIDLTLAPCADINSNPLNPIIGVRSFGSASGDAARHVAAAVAGFRAGGVAVCAKHFPGHGDTHEDTHVGPARIEAPMATLTTRELPPFAAAIDAGVDAILTAHLVAAALDDEPVSLSAPWTEFLRTTMGFDGVIITDALDMDGVAQGRGIDGVADAAVRALVAGADLLCLGSNFDAAMTDTVVDAVVGAMADGRIDRDRLTASHARIGALHGIRRVPPMPASLVTDVAERVARSAVVVTGELSPGPFAVLECRPRLSMASFNVAWGIVELADELGWMTRTVAETDPRGAVCDAFVLDAADRTLVIAVRDASVHRWQGEVIDRCVAARPDAVVIEFGWPPPTSPTCGTYVLTHGAARVSAQAVIDRLKES